MKHPIMLKLLINQMHQPPLPLMERNIATILKNIIYVNKMTTYKIDKGV